MVSDGNIIYFILKILALLSTDVYQQSSSNTAGIRVVYRIYVELDTPNTSIQLSFQRRDLFAIVSFAHA